MATGKLAILGSGETAPNMVRVYRDLLDELTPRAGVMLDSPFGFQENVPQLTAKIIDYFATSLSIEMDSASLLDVEYASELDRAQFRERVESSGFVFSGPGSPSYAMRQWGPVGLGECLWSVLSNGAIVSFASAAAVTLGRYTAPIYELYKVGDRPHWLEGLDILGRAGLNCVVIPHFDNAEGQNHDTRFCYLGERRLVALEQLLEPGIATLGVDEHTAVVIDLTERTMNVRGRGAAHWRTNGDEIILSSDESWKLDELPTTTAPRPIQETITVPATADLPQSLGETAALGGPESARALARLIHLAENSGEGLIDPTTIVNGVLTARAAARSAGNFDVADQLRDALISAGIEVHDGPNGATWSLRES